MTDNGLPRQQGRRAAYKHGGRTREGTGLAARNGTTFRGSGLGSNGLANRAIYVGALRKLWHHKYLLASIVLVGVCGATIVAVRLPAYYVAHGFVAIGDPLGSSRLYSDGNRGGGVASSPDTPALQTEVEILKSPQFAIEVVHQLKLQDNP
jgi:uncharacterized protein involved in exopolysaccharide biosynthesis